MSNEQLSNERLLDELIYNASIGNEFDNESKIAELRSEVLKRMKKPRKKKVSSKGVAK